uniref:Titin n=1 Tax=Sander lucioperca TaxID=283035 RepID=A0A8C9ZEN5_SANLU
MAKDRWLKPKKSKCLRYRSHQAKFAEPKDLGLPVITKDVEIEPSINLLFTTYSVKAGDDLTLEVPVKGRPKPVVSWKKDSLPLKQTSSVTILNTPTSSKIIFKEATVTFNVKVMDTPGPPQGVAFKEVSRGTVTLIWEPPLNDGGARIQHYIVEKREASRRTWQQSGGNCKQHILKIQDLLEGVPYFFRVSAENHHGVGEAFEMIEPVIATAEPASPKRLDIVDTTDSSVTLGWLKPEHDGGSRIQGYFIEAKPKGTDKWVVVGNTTNLTYVIEKLNKGDEYDFRVKAKNESGYSTPRETLAPALVKEPHIEPAADLREITDQLITCRSGSMFTIDVPISGRPAPKVSWKLEEMRLKNTDRVTIKTTKNRTSISVKEAMRGDGGKYYLTLENVAGTKTFTVEVNVTGRPSPPVGPIEISNITSESCVVNWQPPEDDGGTKITNYIVEKRESGSTAWQLINSSVKRTSLDGEYTCKGINDAGEAETTGVLVLEAPASFNPDYPLKETYYASLGSTLRIHAVYIGRPEPKIMWLHGAKTLENTEDLSIETTEHYTHLVIKNVQRRLNGGKYRIRLHNHFGRSEAAFNVEIYGKFMFIHCSECIVLR